MRGEISSNWFFFRHIALSCGAITRNIGVILFSCDAHGVIRDPFKGPSHEPSTTAMTRSRTGHKFLLGEFDKLLFALGVPEIVLPFHVSNRRKSPATSASFLILNRTNGIWCTPIDSSILLHDLLRCLHRHLRHCIIQRLEVFVLFVYLYSRKVQSFEFISTKITKLCYTVFCMGVFLVEFCGYFKVLLEAVKRMKILLWGWIHFLVI